MSSLCNRDVGVHVRDVKEGKGGGRGYSSPPPPDEISSVPYVEGIQEWGELWDLEVSS